MPRTTEFSAATRPIEANAIGITPSAVVGLAGGTLTETIVELQTEINEANDSVTEINDMQSLAGILENQLI
jgi:hypothetical protein